MRLNGLMAGEVVEDIRLRNDIILHVIYKFELVLATASLLQLLLC